MNGQAEDEQYVTEILQKIQRDINCLSDDNKTTRRRALDKIKRETIQKHPPPAVNYLLFDDLVKPFLRLFSDPVEKCRELAISLVSEFMSSTTDPVHFLPLIIPVVVARLGTPDITETSEEVRLQLVTFLSVVIEQSKGSISPYLHDFVTILRQTILDPYPEVKKESCICCCRLISAAPHVFHQESELLVKSILQSLNHQHSKVRIACLKALGLAIQHGSATPINDALPSLAQRSCDPTPSVRLHTIKIISSWLLDLPDRYSYHHKLIPLLLTGLNDEVDEIRHTANDLWNKVGDKYEQENEGDLKDKMDFVKPKDAYPGLDHPRPSLGCRVLVYRNFSKILPALLHDIVDWTVNSRIKSSQLLYILLYHLEDNATHHIQGVLNGLYRACQDEEKAVAEQAVNSARVIGYYVTPEIWCHLVLPAVRVSAGCVVHGSGGSSNARGPPDVGSSVAVGPVQCTGCINVLSSLIAGCTDDRLLPHLPAIVDCISEPEVGQSDHLPLLKHLVSCVSAIVATPSFPSSLSLLVFMVLLRVGSSRQQHGTIAGDVHNAMTQLATVLNLDNVASLYNRHAEEVIAMLKEGYKNWGVYSPDCALFAALLSGEGAGFVEGGVMSDVTAMLAHCTHPDQDPELRLRFVTLLIQLIISKPKDRPSPGLQNAAINIINDVIMPCCIWRAGRTAAAIRTAAMTCAQALLQYNILSEEQLHSVMDNILPQVVSCLDEDSQSTRLVSCKVVRLLLQQSPQYFTADKLHDLYSDLFKRLDDSSNEVRLEMSNTLAVYFKTFPEDYDSHLYQAHTEQMYKTLLIHLDDPTTSIQESILLVLKASSALNGPMLVTMVESVRDKHRTMRYCDELLAHLST